MENGTRRKQQKYVTTNLAARIAVRICRIQQPFRIAPRKSQNPHNNHGNDEQEKCDTTNDVGTTTVLDRSLPIFLVLSWFSVLFGGFLRIVVRFTGIVGLVVFHIQGIDRRFLGRIAAAHFLT